MSLRLLALLALVSPLSAAEAPSTLLAQPDKELVADALTKDATAAQWKIAKGKWERTADGIRVEELPADMHGAAGRVNTKLQDFIAAFEFRSAHVPYGHDFKAQQVREIVQYGLLYQFYVFPGAAGDG